MAKIPNPTLRTVKNAGIIYNLHEKEKKSYRQIAQIVGKSPRQVMRLMAWYEKYAKGDLPL